MRHNPAFAQTDPDIVRTLIAENPWATIVSHANGELVASHYPVLLDEEAEGLAIVSHVGRPDEKKHLLGSGEVLLIVAGPHGYISPSWYVEGEAPVPTWNFSVAHCYGVPEILDADENLRVLTRLVDHFERQIPEPALLERDYAIPIAKGTVGLRIPIDRFELKRKLSQNKSEETRRSIIEALRGGGPYRHTQLAEEMERELGD